MYSQYIHWQYIHWLSLIHCIAQENSRYLCCFLQSVPASDIICDISENSKPYGTTCTGSTKKGDVYVYVRGNNKYNINYALSVSFQSTANKAKNVSTVGSSLLLSMGRNGGHNFKFTMIAVTDRLYHSSAMNLHSVSKPSTHMHFNSA